MNTAAGIILVLGGLAFNAVGCVGLIRFPDIYNRLQAATKCVTLGTCLLLLGIMLLAGGCAGALVAKCGLCLVFILITSPTAAHALARGAHASGVRLWEKSILDQYETDHEPGIQNGEAE
jgi:multicomponent Na+:H+ antiporter subunit G